MNRTRAALLILLAGLVLTARPSLASNMGFRFNKGIAPLGVPAPVGQNWVALPFTNIYANAEAVCAALGLTPGIGLIRQIDPATGITFSHTCGNAGPFPRGFNLFPVPYNSTACTAQDLCTQIGLPLGATVRRLNAATGVTQSHSCGGAGAFPLVLGECVAIQYPGAVIGFVPPHF